MKKLIQVLMFLMLGAGFAFTSDSPDKNYDFGLYLQGGHQESSDADTSETGLKGELAFAKSFDDGLFLQASAMLDNTDALEQTGESIGAGYQLNDRLGIYGFMDFLQYKLDGYDTTTHYQLRPGIKYEITDRLELFVHAGIPVSDDKYAGDVMGSEYYAENSSGLYRMRHAYEVYNRALAFANTELETLIGEKMSLSLKGTLAEEGVYALAVEDRFYVTPQWCASVEAGFADNKDFPMVSEDLEGENWHVLLGVSWKPFARDLDSARKGMIYPRAYPMIVQELKGRDPAQQSSSGPLSLNVVTTIDSRTVPCQVSFIIRAEGGLAPYTYTINYGDGTQFSVNSQNGSSGVQVIRTSAALLNYSHRYNTPGRYSWSVNVTDGLGYSASQQGTLNITNSAYTIQASAGPGGTISPSGSLSVEEGGSITFTFTPHDDYFIKRIVVDGQNVYTIPEMLLQPSSYTFQNVRGNHTIYVEFTEFA